MVTYGWHLEARHGHLTQRASQPNPWRWMPTSWRPRTPTNLEVRPLPGRGGSSLTRQLQLYLLQAFSYPPTPPHFSFAMHPFSSMLHQWHQVCLFFFFQQCVKYASFWNFLCSISWSCTLTAGGHVCHLVTSSQQSLNHDKIFSVYVFNSDYGRLTTDWCVFANVCGQIPVHAGTFWLILAFVNQFEWLFFFFFCKACATLELKWKKLM